MKNAKITYIFPCRQRVNKFFDCLANITGLSESKNYEIICAFDEDDECMNNDDVRAKISEYPNVKYYYGISANKIAACNREIGRISADTSIVCLHSDDMLFLKQGFDNDIREAFSTHFPDFSGVVHFPDTFAKARTMTYTMMGIGLFRLLGYLYHREFLSVYADNHLTDMTKKMGKYAFVDKPILDHFHPISHKAAWDSQYRRTEAKENYRIDRETYLKLQANNYGL
jgi:hypothetical protein